jgi:hypothetical protein
MPVFEQKRDEMIEHLVGSLPPCPAWAEPTAA